jgi:hypothetical protein
MYRFYGEPLQPIKSKQTGKVIFVFDTKGEYLTDDENIIRRCLGFFDNIKLDAKTISELEKKTKYNPPMTITYKDDKKEKIEVKKIEIILPELPVKHCKKCDFTATNQGDLLAHYREKHSKEVK